MTFLEKPELIIAVGAIAVISFLLVIILSLIIPFLRGAVEKKFKKIGRILWLVIMFTGGYFAAAFFFGAKPEIAFLVGLAAIAGFFLVMLISVLILPLWLLFQYLVLWGVAVNLWNPAVSWYHQNIEFYLIAALVTGETISLIIYIILFPLAVYNFFQKIIGSVKIIKRSKEQDININQEIKL